MNVIGSTCVGVIAAGALLGAGPVDAVTRERSFVQNATGFCQPALPVFDGQIRKRPLALQNEGTAAAFVSCSFMGTDRTETGVSTVLLHADNNTNAAVSMTCTLVVGLSGFSAEYITKTRTLAANAKTVVFTWNAADHGGLPFTTFTTNASCSVPVGVGLTAGFVYYDVDVGS